MWSFNSMTTSLEELIEELSFPVYRRIATMIFVPRSSSAVEMVAVDPRDLQAFAHGQRGRREPCLRRYDGGDGDPVR